MKILIALHQVMDLGGIINHTEQLMAGLQEEGHTVHLKEFVWAYNAPSQRKEADWFIGASGVKYDQQKGWNFSNRQRIPYRGGANISGAKQIMARYDIIIWTIPVPSKSANNRGNDDWPDLYDLPDRIKQIGFIHDGNSRKGYPHLLHIESKLKAVACVHHCAWNGSSHLSVPRALVLNPQHNPVRDVVPWEYKTNGFINMQTFKGWKRVHELIEAIAYMPKRDGIEMRHVAGKGIEYQYMTSENKCKPNYFHGDNEQWFSSQKFWEAALSNGMIWTGYWNEVERDQFLTQARVLVDPSWSNNYSDQGGHYNRVLVEAMIHGLIPVARLKGVGDDLFEPGEHYVAIPEHIGPQEYADLVLETSNKSHLYAQHFREAALDRLHLFDRRRIAKQVVRLAMSDFNEDEVKRDEVNPDAQKKSEDIMFDHFGIM